MTTKKADTLLAAKIVLMFFLIGICITACTARRWAYRRGMGK